MWLTEFNRLERLAIGPFFLPVFQRIVSMPLKFKCRCGTVLTVPTQRVGKSVRCPFCNETLVIPDPASRRSSQPVPPNRLESASSLEDKQVAQAGDVEAVQSKREPPAVPIAKSSVKPEASQEQSVDARIAKAEASIDLFTQDHVLPETGQPDRNTVLPAWSGRETRPQHSDVQADQAESIRFGAEQAQQTSDVGGANDAIATSKDSTPQRLVTYAVSVDQQAESRDQPVEKLAIEEPLEPTTVPSSDPDGTQGAVDEPSELRTSDHLAERASTQKAGAAIPDQTALPQNSETAGEKQEQPDRPRDVVKRPPPIKPKSTAYAAPPPRPKQPANFGQSPATGVRGMRDPQPKPDKQRQVAKSKPDEAGRRPRVRGVEHARANRWMAYYLALGVIFVALINIAPAFHQGMQALRNEAPQPFARWTYGALILGLIQMAYAVYLIQLPDWSSVWVVAVLSLVTTTLYAALVSVVLLGGNDSSLFQSLQLAHGSRRSAALWCLIMLIISASLTYFAGRVGIRWQKVFSTAYPVVVKKS